jgi:hypothetical protein
MRMVVDDDQGVQMPYVTPCRDRGRGGLTGRAAGTVRDPPAVV